MTSVTLLVGGRSRLARAIARVVPHCRAVFRGHGADGVVVDDYATVPDAVFADVRSVINCVGTPHGDPATLTAVNVDVAVAAAVRARANGCRQFVQISSLSVYGGATAIDAETAVDPISDYGRSKAAADAALLALAGPEFSVIILRVPALYGIGAAGKFGQLARAMAVLGVFPVIRPLARRSVLHLDNAAAAIATLVDAPATASGVMLAADHDIFTLAALADAVSATQSRRVRLTAVPGWMASLGSHLAPRAFGSLFADSLIAPAAALTTPLTLPVKLADGMVGMLAANRSVG